MATTTLVYLPDGNFIYLPDPPFFPDPGHRVSAPDMTQCVGQIGFWYAQRLLFQGLTTTAQAPVVATWTDLNLQSEMIDNYDIHTGTSANVVIPQTRNGFIEAVDDFYLCIGYVPISTTAGSGQTFIAGIYDSIDGTNYEGMKIPGPAGHNPDCMVVEMIMITGDPNNSPQPNIRLRGYNTLGGVNTQTSSKTPSITARWVGSGVAYNTLSVPPTTPHTWIPQDQMTSVATGASPVSPGIKVPINTEASYVNAFYYSPPLARITTQASTQTITNTGAFVSVQYPTGSMDLWGMWSSGSNTRLTCQRAGLYFVYGYVNVTETSTKAGYRACRLLVNGTTAYGGNTTVPVTGTATIGTGLNAVALIQMSVGDYVEFQFAHTNGSALSVNTGAGNSGKLIAIWQSA